MNFRMWTGQELYESLLTAGVNHTSISSSDLSSPHSTWNIFRVTGCHSMHETTLDFQLPPGFRTEHHPRIRADMDAHSLRICPATQGLDDLLLRLQAAVAASGAHFSKWRSPILCNSTPPHTHTNLKVQAKSLARCAAISHQIGLTIVGPD
ncbi:hypothetical protein P692DRAFT_20859663, partial [Suillus brevipes Sb2]